MNYNCYNCGCLITSILMLLLIIFKLNIVSFGIVLLFAALFSILWRSTKLINGQHKIEEDNQYMHPLFILDLSFAILAFICIFISKQINIKFIFLSLLTICITWVLYFCEYEKASNNIHFCAHCYIVLFFILTFYFNII